MIILYAIGYSNEPFLLFISDDNHKKIKLDPLGGEECRTQESLEIRLKDDKLIISGLDPKRTIISCALASHLKRMGLSLSIEKIKRTSKHTCVSCVHAWHAFLSINRGN